ncbi:neprilysin-1-like [Haemaphysalis longicornis]
MLRFDAVKDNATDPDCTHDARENVLYLRLSSAVETHDIRSPLWPLLQAARLAPMLSRCMLRVLLLPETPPHREAQHRGNRFSTAGSARFNELLACLRAHHTLGRSALTGRGRGTRAVIHSAALEPARNAYDAYVVRLARETSLEQLIGSRDALTTLGWNQLYYVAYARAMCESPDHRGPKEPHIPQRELVNGPLSNDRGFHRAFNCRRGDPMRPEPTCHFWDRPPR